MTRYFRIFLILLIAAVGCEKKSDLKPRRKVPGFKGELLFEDTFDAPRAEWIVEGGLDLVQDADGWLRVSLKDSSTGGALWIPRYFKGDFLLEYQIDYPDSAGYTITILNAHGLQGEDIFKDQPPRAGLLEEYSRGNIRSYHISTHCYSSDGTHIPGSKLRKNPGHRLFGRADDPCVVNRPYYVDVVKTGNRIHYYVDGQSVHDVRDKGGFDRAYLEGYIGFWLEGHPATFHVRLNDVRVFKLIPN